VEGLRMMEFAEVSPKAIVIIGVEPKEIGWGLEISPELQVQVPRIIDLVKEEIDN
jgi:hydrogenase maturation protease